MDSAEKMKRFMERMTPEQRILYNEKKALQKRQRSARRIAEEDNTLRRSRLDSAEKMRRFMTRLTPKQRSSYNMKKALQKRQRMREDRVPDLTSSLRVLCLLRLVGANDFYLKKLLEPYRHVKVYRWLRACRALEVAPLRLRIRKRRNVRTELRRIRHPPHRDPSLRAKYRARFLRLQEELVTIVSVTERQPDLPLKEAVGKAQKQCALARLLRTTCQKELARACTLLRGQMDPSAVHHPSAVRADAEKTRRAVCRIAYHLARKDTTGAVPLTTLFPRLYRRFMLISEEEHADRVAACQLRNDVAITVACMLTALENMDGPSTSADERDAPDAENILIEEMGDLQLDEESPAEVILDPEMDHADADAVREEGEQLVLQDPELGEAAGPQAAHYAPRITFVTECACPRMTAPQACQLRSALLSMIQIIEADLEEATKKGVDATRRWTEDGGSKAYEALQDFEQNGFPGLKKSSVCYSGVRSILARYYAVRSLVRLLHRVERSFGRDATFLTDALEQQNWKWLPKPVRTVVEATYSDDATSARMTETSVLGLYGPTLQAIAAKIAQTESVFCDICDRAREESQIRRMTGFQVHKFMRESVRAEREADREGRVQVCKKCVTEASAGRRSLEERQRDPLLPSYSVVNAIDFDETPSVLIGLNWIEEALIQLIRPVRSVMCLSDVGGRQTTMRSAKGAMVLLPVPVSGTLRHVGQTLPSEAGLTISVTPEAAKGKLVRLPVVLRALRWLKEHNHLYADVIIDEAFQFTGSAVHFTGRSKSAGPPTAADFAALVSDNAEEETLLQHIEMEEQVVRPMHAPPTSGLPHEQYALLRNPYEPRSVDTPNVDVMSFPWHFPTGRFGVHHDRQKRMSLRDMARWWLACRDRRLGRDPQFLSFLHGLLEQIDLTSSLGVQARFSRGALVGETFLSKISEGSADFEGQFHTGARALRGHVAYFDLKRQEVRAHVGLFGAATFFVTLSPAERRWEEVGDLYRKVYGDDVTPNTLFSYVSKDPYWFARCFQQRLRAVFGMLLLGGGPAGGPLGRVLHHFIRIEYQHRGTQHAHCMLWIEGAPAVTATDDERLEFIDRYVSARMPDPKKEPELHAIIKGENMHYETHSETCRRQYKIQGKVLERCRFDFPRPCTPKSIVNRRAQELHSLPGTRVKKYYLKRRPADIWVNDYSPALSLAWKGNTDVQYVWSNCAEVVNYVTGYVTKNEKSKDVREANQILWQTANNKEAFKAHIDMMRHRQCGLLEIVDTVIGHCLTSFDSGHIYVNTNAADKRDRMLRPKVDIEEEVVQGDTSAIAYKDNAIDVYYPGRSAALEDSCLLNVIVRFRVAAVKKNGQPYPASTTDGAGEEEADEADVIGAPRTATSRNEDPFEAHFHVHCRKSPFFDHERATTNLHWITGVRGARKAHILLGRPLVPRFFWPNLEESNAESREDYFRRLCLLFIPWRNEEDLKGGEESFEARWTSHIASLEEESPDAAEDVKAVIAHREALLQQDRETTERRNAQRALLNALRVDDDPEGDGPVVFDRDVDAEDHRSAVEGMNAGQRQIFDDVINHISAQEAHRVALEAIRADRALQPADRAEAIAHLGDRPEAFLRVVVGTAGCGKSFLINTIADALTLAYTTPEKRATEPAAVLAAPTGLAAVQIRGSTIHSLLGIEVQHGRDPAMRPLRPITVTRLRLQFRNVKVLIVDELSMVSAIVLAKMHLRLQEILASTELFGGMNVILLGDLMQLPPVAAPAIYDKMGAFTINRLFGSMLPEFGLFEQFSYAELTENMRQQGDLAFGAMLQRLRVQALTDDDITMLRTRLIEREAGETAVESAVRVLVEQMARTTDGGPPPMALFSTNAEVKQFNRLAIEKLQLQTCVVEAEDSIARKEGGFGARRARNDPKTRRIYQDAEYDITRAPGSGRRGGKRRRVGAERPEDEEEEERMRAEEDTNKAAGLEKHLLLAENGRCMLRRNLDPAAGLVNGACGVLKSVIRGADNEPIALRIAFDGLKEHVIEKVSATFDLSDDETQTRRQFPIVMAFGATIHKCQGMTLPSAIVTTSKFFGPAQGFVALSRVRTLDTLFLVDLHTDKLKCSRPALAKYNELRASVGLPVFSEPVVRRSFRTEEGTRDGAPPATPRGASTARPSTARLWLPTRGLGADTPTTRAAPKRARRRIVDDEIPLTRARQDDEVERQRRDAPEDDDTDEHEAGSTLRLANPRADCWIIGAMNLIHSLPAVRDDIIEASEVLQAAGQLTPPMAEMVEVLRGHRRDVVGLRTIAGWPNGWGDVREALCDTLQNFQEVYDKYFLTRPLYHLTCAAGHETTVEPGPMYQIRIEVTKLDAGVVAGTIDDLVNKCLAHDVTCGECGSPITSATMDPRPAGQYVMLEINRSVFNNNTRLPDRPLALDGVHARRRPAAMLACVQHLAWNRGFEGHYVVWKRIEGEGRWLVIDDNHPVKVVRQLPNRLHNIHLIVYKLL